MEQDILAILCEINPYADVDANTKLMEEDVLDSMGILVLISELELKYGITILLEKLELKHFETIGSISEFVKECVAEQN